MLPGWSATRPRTTFSARGRAFSRHDLVGEEIAVWSRQTFAWVRVESCGKAFNRHHLEARGSPLPRHAHAPLRRKIGDATDADDNHAQEAKPLDGEHSRSTISTVRLSWVSFSISRSERTREHFYGGQQKPIAFVFFNNRRLSLQIHSTIILQH